ncbi:hypothetical protein [Metabacillus iocasae]|uniref:Photosystem II protein J n=1 Tax=Priestia iocasae TaxID=2291674 RepID=A0ABS2QSM1_9BACI|nr:hypothetical protein [Metabacillus iocasae]MBM7702459.1 hypothetical protein [Metabacillus iocasae]
MILVKKSKKWSTANIPTVYFVVFGLVIGAFMGLASYINNWI